MKNKNAYLSESDRNKILHDANNMLKGIYIFDEIWDMEPCHNQVLNKKIKWNIRYNGDVEWSYMFTRMDYLYKLIIASQVTNDNKYIKHGLKIIKKWYKNNRKYINKYTGKINRVLFKNSFGHRSLDVAIMMSNIVDYAIYCKDNNIINSKQYNKYLHIVKKNINYIIPLSDGCYKSYSNWGIIENANIIYCMNKLKITNKYEEISSRLTRQVYNQIMSNGSQIESSPMYLVQILLSLLKVINSSDNKLSNDLIKPTIEGFNYILSIRNLDNCIPNIGDSDITNISDLMFLAAIILDKDEYLKYINKDIEPQFYYKYDINNKNTKKNNIKKTELIEYNNQTIYRSFTDNIYLICSNIPKIVDGHKHYDYMSMIYSGFGKEILVDLGRVTYKNCVDRKNSISAYSHNTIEFPNDRFYKYNTSWITTQKIECLNNKVTSGDNWFNVEMKCIFGYNEANVIRNITFIDKIGLIITDIIDDIKNDEYISYFNIGNEFDIKYDNKNIELISNEKTVYYNNSMNIKPKIKKVIYSKKYNTYVKTNQLKIKTNQRIITHYFLNDNNIDIKTKSNNKTIDYYIDKTNITIIV